MGEEWENAPGRMKRLGQSGNHAQLWVWSGGEKIKDNRRIKKTLEMIKYLYGVLTNT